MKTEFDYAKALPTDTSIDFTLAEDDNSAEYDPRQYIYYLVGKIGTQRLLSLVMELSGDLESCIDTIGRQSAMDAFCDMCDGWDCYQEKCSKLKWIRELPPAQTTRLTDTEKRIFLTAMAKEEMICRKVDEEDQEGINLVEVCREIERKVKGVLWT